MDSPDKAPAEPTLEPQDSMANNIDPLEKRESISSPGPNEPNIEIEEEEKSLRGAPEEAPVDQEPTEKPSKPGNSEEPQVEEEKEEPGKPAGPMSKE